MSTLRVEVTGMAHGGDAVARHEGKVLFVPYAIPGEELLVELVEERDSYSRAWPIEVIKPSPDRIDPLCLHFGICGGCHWQHISYGRQLALREEILASQLARIGHLPDALIKDTLAADEPWYYRNHVQLHLDEEGRLGFFSTRDRHMLAISECHIMHPLLCDMWSALEVDFPGLETVSLRASATLEEQMVILWTAQDAVPEVEVDLPISCVLVLPDGTPITYVGNPYITEVVGRTRLRISPTSFFQVNTAQTEGLLSTVLRFADTQGDELLLDLYCGVGTFGLNLAEAVGQVLGIDSSEAAIADAVFNAQGATNVRFLRGPVEQLLETVEEKVGLAVLDPPRKGLGKEALSALIDKAPTKIIYVSCDPATLARDVRGLAQAGYELVEVQPIDMFPQTYHVEAVALLRRPGC